MSAPLPTVISAGSPTMTGASPGRGSISSSRSAASSVNRFIAESASWPGLSRPSTSNHARKSWMLGTRPGMTEAMGKDGGRGKSMTDIRPLRSYGRRKAKPLSARKERLIGERCPRLRLYLSGPPPAALTELFQTPVNDVWLEIGFGSGEHLLLQAETHKDVGFIGCEPFINGLGTLLGAIEDRGVGTMRVHDGDAREVLTWLPKRSIGRVFLLFPDPWPKKRQLKRRLLFA